MTKTEVRMDNLEHSSFVIHSSFLILVSSFRRFHTLIQDLCHCDGHGSLISFGGASRASIFGAAGSGGVATLG